MALAIRQLSKRKNKLQGIDYVKLIKQRTH